LKQLKKKNNFFLTFDKSLILEMSIFFLTLI
jgi:hypothetical protein